MWLSNIFSQCFFEYSYIVAISIYGPYSICRQIFSASINISYCIRKQMLIKCIVVWKQFVLFGFYIFISLKLSPEHILWRLFINPFLKNGFVSKIFKIFSFYFNYKMLQIHCYIFINAKTSLWFLKKKLREI